MSDTFRVARFFIYHKLKWNFDLCPRIILDSFVIYGSGNWLVKFLHAGKNLQPKNRGNSPPCTFCKALGNHIKTSLVR